ncbi:MAG: pentapeptide repeat-containing protein [candidate division Zixibacteria bacterium]|nr:pentapeptide repeat-containing protein [candidate division Zixibacteria bacterium]
MRDTCIYKETIGEEDYECPREVGQPESFCNLHNPDLNKNQHEFAILIERELKDQSTPEADFRGVVFPEIPEILRKGTITKHAVFDHATFRGKAVFDETVFEQFSSFDHTTFSRGVAFNGVTFKKGCQFLKAKFDGRQISFDRSHFYGVTKIDATFGDRVSFDGAYFHGDVFFNRSNFSSHSKLTARVFEGIADFTDCSFKESVTFGGVEFRGPTTFHFKHLSNGPNFQDTKFLGKTTFAENIFAGKDLTFRSCDLSGARVLDLPIVKGKVEFDDCNWPKIRSGLFKLRHCIADEKTQSKSLSLLQAYRWFHEYYFSKSEFGLASDFYIGFMRAKRKVRKKNLFSKGIDVFYFLFSQYGESILRPCFALFLMWLLVPAILLTLGVKLDPGKNAPEVYFVWGEGSCILFLKEYWSTFILNVSLTTLFRTSDLRPPLTSVQHTVLMIETIFNGLFLAFLGLGIRRTFAPKKPLSTTQ